MASDAVVIAGPIRTCVGCRKSAPQHQLLRVVLVGDHVVPDLSRRLNGRGAYLHRNPDCIERAIQRRSLIRALRAFGELKFDRLIASIQ